MTVLKPGDLVVLKSGGPVMTVDAVNTDIFDDDKVTGIFCAWFVGDRLERARFDLAALVPAPSPGRETREAPPHEVTGEYKTVLEEMVAAMNDAADASKLVATGTEARASGKSKRAASAGAERAARQPAPPAQMD